MILNRKPFESDLDRLEREANDDFSLLDELGPAHFGFEHLLELREKMRDRMAVFHRRQRLSMVIGASAAVWIAIAFAARVFNYPWISFAAYGVGSLSILVFLAMGFWQKKTFESKGELDYTRQVIEEELRRRTGMVYRKPGRN